MERRRKFGVPRRRVALLCAAAAAITAMALPSAAQAQGQGKRVMIYTGTTGFRHTDGINDGRPIIQAKLEELGYTVDWEDCNGRALPGATPTADALQPRRTRTRASSRRRTSRATTRSCS